MRRAALTICALLLATQSCFAATADELWQDYQKKPAVVSTTPVKPAERTEPARNVTVEAKDGATTTPTTPDEAIVKAETHDAAATEAQDADAGVETEELDTAPEATKAEVNTTPIAEVKQENNPVAKQTVVNAKSASSKTSEPTISNKPVADKTKPKPKPKLQLVGKPPLPRQFMRTPQGSDFASVTSVAGGYSISLPSAFGADPLAGLPQTEGAMLVRTKDDTLMCAVTVIDATDTTSFNALEPLPTYGNAKVHWSWQQEAALLWNMKLSSHNDYHGDKMLLEANAKQNGKTYQMLFVMPAKYYTELLPQAVYALNSFRLN